MKGLGDLFQLPLLPNIGGDHTFQGGFVKQECVLHRVEVFVQALHFPPEHVSDFLCLLSKDMNGCSNCKDLHVSHLLGVDTNHLSKLLSEDILSLPERQQVIMIDVTQREKVVTLGHVDGLSGRSDKGLNVVHVLVVPQFKLLLVVLNLIMRQD